MTRPITLAYHPPKLTGRLFYTDLEAVRYEVLAVSANGAVALRRRQVRVSNRRLDDNTLATMPVHRIHTHADYIEAGPWLTLFTGFQAVQA